MDDKAKKGGGSSFPKDLPWQEMKAKVNVDESIFEKRGIQVKDDDVNKKQRNQVEKKPGGSKKEDQEFEVSDTLPLPHKQVPQPDEFSTQALEQL